MSGGHWEGIRSSTSRNEENANEDNGFDHSIIWYYLHLHSRCKTKEIAVN